MIQFFFCAWGGECNTGGLNQSLIRAYARGVVGTEAFRLFVQIESNERGDIALYYANTGLVEDVLRYKGIPGSAIVTGNFYMSFLVNATRRTIIDSYLEFIPNPRTNDGINNPFCTRFFCPGGEKLLNFDGWSAKLQRDQSESSVGFSIDAGPEGTYLGNPFSFFRDVDGVGVKMQWGARFENGNLNVDEASASGVGGLGLPFINLLNVEQNRSYYGY